VTYAISDVHAPIEDDPSVIASGPTVADRSTFADAVTALRQARLWDRVPAAVRARLGAGVHGDVPETIKPGDPRLADAAFVLAGSRWDAMEAAASAARERGYHVVIVPEPTLGEARDAARRLVDRALRVREGSAGPLCLVASGETTVAVGDAHGKGGRNQEFGLAAAADLAGTGAVLISVGTDGIDGPTDAAGAIVDGTTLARAGAAGLDAAGALTGHASYDFFRALGDLVITGPTGTNVGDLQVALFA
jgi:glycerate-2-kinase